MWCKAIELPTFLPFSQPYHYFIPPWAEACPSHQVSCQASWLNLCTKAQLNAEVHTQLLTSSEKKERRFCAPFSFYWFPTKSLNTFYALLQIFSFWITTFAALLILLLWEHSKIWLPQLRFFCVQNCITDAFKNTYDIYKASSKHY